MENEEIDLIEVMAKLWHRKKTIMYIALFFLVGGLVLAFFLPRKYTAQCTLGLEMEDRTTRISVEGMSPFQSMPMGDMRNTRIVSPAMYPDIFFSVPFQKELIYSPLYIDERGDTVTFYNYLVSGPEYSIDYEFALQDEKRIPLCMGISSGYRFIVDQKRNGYAMENSSGAIYELPVNQEQAVMGKRFRLAPWVATDRNTSGNRCTSVVVYDSDNQRFMQWTENILDVCFPIVFALRVGSI